MNEELQRAIRELTGETVNITITTDDWGEYPVTTDLSDNTEPVDEYVPGSAAPQLEPPEEEPEKEPEEEQKPKPTPKPKIRRPSYAFSSVLTILGIIVIALGAFFLLSREVTIQEQKNSITELQGDINKLYIERDSLFTQYTSTIDLANIRKLAAEYGMHAPAEDQIVELD